MENTTLRRVGRIVAGGLAALVLLSSCIKDHSFVPDTVPDGEKATVTFKVRVPGTNSSGTRGMDERDEMKVARIDVLLFTVDGNYVGRAESEKIDNDNSNASIKTFTVDLPKGNWDIMLLANAGDMVNGIDPAPGQYNKIEVTEELVMGMAGKWPTDGSIPFPMWCDAGMVQISKGMDLSDRGWRLTRMVASVDVTVANGANFELKEVFLYNYNNTGRLIPDDSNWSDTKFYPNLKPTNVGMVTAPTVAGITVKGPLKDYPIEDGACKNEIYIFEYDNFTAASEPKESDNRICLVVGGEYNNLTTYYRIDFSQGQGAAQEFKNVLRNHKYIFSIDKVTGHGYDTPEEAFVSGSSNIEVNVNDWNESELNLWVIGQYYFSINSLVAEYMGQAQEDCELIFRTNYDITNDFVCEASLSENYSSHDPSRDKPGWLRVKEPTGPVNDKYTILYDIDMNDSGDDRVAYIHIKTHTLEAKITVTQLLDRFTTVTLSPDGTIPAEGREITITANVTDGGYFDSFVILAQDEDNGEILGAGTMPASGNDTYKTTAITIPEYWSAPSHTAPTERAVLFKYVGNTNAQWITIGELKQESYWINVTCPEFTGGNDMLHANSEIYTVSVWGEWSDNLYFRFWDETNKQVINIKEDLGAGSASAAAPGNFKLELKENPSVGERVVRLEYSVNGGNRWYTVGEREQAWDYRFTLIVDSFDNGIPKAGGTYRITLTGNWPDLKVQALDMTNGGAPIHTVNIDEGNGLLDTKYIIIDTNDSWYERQIAIVYYAQGQGEGKGTIGIQEGYSISGIQVTPRPINPKGGAITVEVVGDFPDGSPIMVRASSNGISPYTVFGTTDSNNKVLMTLPNNDTGADRTIEFMAYVGSINGKVIGSEVQPMSNIKLSDGTIVAHSNAISPRGHPYLTWSEAMGIALSYDRSTFSNYMNYVPYMDTGCPVYTEEGYSGQWRLPTVEQLREIAGRADEAGLNDGYSYGYWARGPNSTLNAPCWHSSRPQEIGEMTKESQIYVRCVRVDY